MRKYGRNTDALARFTAENGNYWDEFLSDCAMTRRLQQQQQERGQQVVQHQQQRGGQQQLVRRGGLYSQIKQFHMEKWEESFHKGCSMKHLPKEDREEYEKDLKQVAPKQLSVIDQQAAKEFEYALLTSKLERRFFNGDLHGYFREMAQILSVAKHLLQEVSH